MPKSNALLKIEQLHPKIDAWEIVRLSMYYEFPWDYNRALELALYKTYAVPSISKILHQSNEFEKFPQKRYDDTDLILSEIIEHGIEENSRGLQALKHLNWIHSNYKISNEDYLYVLSTFIFDTAYWINNFAYRKLTQQEELAGFYVWKEIGEKMLIKNIPDSIADFQKFHDAFEQQYFSYSETNTKVARATEDLLLSWTTPKFLFDVARPFLYATMEPHILKAFNYKEPGKALRNLVKQSLRTRSYAVSLVPRKTPFIRTHDHNYPTYPNGYTIEDLGPSKLQQSPNCPYHKMINSIKK